jgi:hypothetical protein
MGTNFYAKTGRKEKVVCNYGSEHIIDEELHIGKYSNGWKFCLHIIPEKNINNLNDWKIILQNSEIKDEYGRAVTYDDMIKKIVGEYKDKGLDQVIAHCDFNKSILVDLNDNLNYVIEDELGKDGSYVLVEGEFN